MGSMRILRHGLTDGLTDGAEFRGHVCVSNKTVGKAQKPLGPRIMKCRGACFNHFEPWDWNFFHHLFPIMFPKGITL